MGVTFKAAGLPYDKGYDCGYGTFNGYLKALAKAVSPTAGDVYAAWLFSDPGYAEEDGTVSKDGCSMDMDFPEYGELLERLLEGAKSREERAAARQKAQELYDKRCSELSQLKLSGFSLIQPIGHLVGAKIRCQAKYADLDKLFSESFGPATGGFLFMPDSEGKLSWKDCRELYKELCDVKVDALGHNYGEVKMSVAADGKKKAGIRTYNMHEQFLGMFKHCWKRHVNLWWS